MATPTLPSANRKIPSGADSKGYYFRSLERRIDGNPACQQGECKAAADVILNNNRNLAYCMAHALLDIIEWMQTVKPKSGVIRSHDVKGEHYGT